MAFRNEFHSALAMAHRAAKMQDKAELVRYLSELAELAGCTSVLQSMGSRTCFGMKGNALQLAETQLAEWLELSTTMLPNVPYYKRFMIACSQHRLQKLIDIIFS
jgi:hypothetical protein